MRAGFKLHVENDGPCGKRQCYGRLVLALSFVGWFSVGAEQEPMHQRDFMRTEIAWMSGLKGDSGVNYYVWEVVHDIVAGGHMDRFMDVCGCETGEFHGG